MKSRKNQSENKKIRKDKFVERSFLNKSFSIRPFDKLLEEGICEGRWTLKKE